MLRGWEGLAELFTLDPWEIKIPERVLAARLGFKGLGKIPEGFQRHFERALEIAIKVARPSALYETVAVEVDGENLVAGPLVLKGKLASQHLYGSSKVTVIAATLGEDFDREVERLHKNGDELSSFFLDGIGSEMVEYFVRALDMRLRNIYGQGSARISPGYGDLPLSLNCDILDFLKTSRIGLRCDPSTYIMIPRKSITAFIGWK